MSHAHVFARVNLMGEHTDYNGGLVLPATIPLGVNVELIGRADHWVQVSSDGFGSGRFRLGREQLRGDFLDYVQGVTSTLTSDGVPLAGFDAKIRSEIPAGAGLASSAAVLVALLRALRDEFSFHMNDLDLALAAYRAESGFVGAPVGVMDPVAVSVGRMGEALFLNTAALTFTRIPIPRAMRILVFDSQMSHHHATGAYRERRAECERAAALLKVKRLCDLTEMSELRHLPAPLNRRAYHVLTENERVKSATRALELSDLTQLGKLFQLSHLSQRDDFECSVPIIDTLVEVLTAQPGILGARLTGGGFGGAVVAIGDSTTQAEAVSAQVTSTVGGRWIRWEEKHD